MKPLRALSRTRKQRAPRLQVSPKLVFFPTRQEGVVRFYVGIHICDASTPRPHPVSRQSSSPVDPAKYPARAARQWIPPSIPPELLASGSRPVSRQSCSPVDPAEYPTRAARQWIPPSIPPSRSPVDPAEYSARAARQWIPPSILPVDPAEYPARVARQWIPHSSSPVDPAEYPAEYSTQ